MNKKNKTIKNIETAYRCTFVAATILGGIVLYGIGRTLKDESNLRLVKNNNCYKIELNYDAEDFINDFNNTINDKNIDPSLQEILNNYDIKYEDLIRDYGDYLDKENLIKRINTLKVELVNNNDEFIKENSDTNKSVEAYYSYKNNIIFLNIDELSLTNYDEVSEVFTHEFFHFLLQKDHESLTIVNEVYTYENLAEISEGFTELLTTESFKIDENYSCTAYPLNVTYARILSEFISNEAGIDFGCFSSKKTINELSQYEDKKKIKILLENMNRDCLNYYNNIYDQDLKDEIVTEIEKIYEEKTNENITDNDDLRYLLLNIYGETNMVDYNKIYYISPEENNEKVYLY